MRKKIGKRKIEAGAIVISVVIGLYALCTVPAIIADTTPPQGQTYEGEVIIWLNASDAHSGVAGINYALDPIQMQPGDPIEYTYVEGDTVNITVNEPGDHIIHYYAVDNVGNEEIPKTYSFTIYDTIAPETFIYIQGTPHTG